MGVVGAKVSDTWDSVSFVVKAASHRDKDIIKAGEHGNQDQTKTWYIKENKTEKNDQ